MIRHLYTGFKSRAMALVNSYAPHSVPLTLVNLRKPSSLPCNNSIRGFPADMRNSKIVFNGSNNILILGDGVTLENSEILFNGDNSIAFLSESRHPYRLSVSMNHNCVFYMGQNNYINGNLHVILSEQKHFFVGEEGLFSFGIWVRTADPHLIYDCESMKRINPSQSIFLGDHVWIGQNVMLLKGTQVDSGSIIGAGAVLSGKKIPHNTIYAGNPAKEIRRGVFWEGSCVHSWESENTVLSKDFRDYVSTRSGVSSPEQFIFSFNSGQQISFDELDTAFSGIEPEEKLSLLHKINIEKHKARFVHTNY